MRTDPLPAAFPTLELLSSDPERMAPGVTLFDVQSTGGGEGYYVIVDADGEVIWFYDTPNNAEDIRRLPNGNFLHNANSRIREVDILGNEIRQWGAASTASGDTIPVVLPPGALRFGHHESFPMPSGNILTFFSQIRSVANYPTSETDPDAPTATSDVLDDVVIEFDPSGAVVNQWSLLDRLDPTRIGYNAVVSKISGAADWAHANAVIYDARDDTILVSARHQDAVVKFARASGDVVWILGTHANWLPPFDALLLTPLGSPFEWPYHQHAPMILPSGNLLLFDNGNNRASPFDPRLSPSYSRAVEYAIDEATGEISQIWEYGSNLTPPLYASFVGDADGLGNDDVLITFGGLNSGGRGVARILEVDRNEPAQVVFDLSVTNPDPAVNGVRVYRSERLPSLYP